MNILTIGSFLSTYLKFHLWNTTWSSLRVHFHCYFFDKDWRVRGSLLPLHFRLSPTLHLAWHWTYRVATIWVNLSQGKPEDMDFTYYAPSLLDDSFAFFQIFVFLSRGSMSVRSWPNCSHHNSLLTFIGKKLLSLKHNTMVCCNYLKGERCIHIDHSMSIRVNVNNNFLLKLFDNICTLLSVWPWGDSLLAWLADTRKHQDPHLKRVSARIWRVSWLSCGRPYQI